MSPHQSILLKNVKIFDQGCPHHLSIRDVLIVDGRIAEIEKNVEQEADRVIDHEGLCISAGWFDIGAYCGEPGLEHRETLETLSDAAQKGGYTGVAVFPNTSPSIDHKSLIDYITNQSAALPTRFYPIGALSKKCKGEELAELLDMHHAGAVAFSDGNRPVVHGGLLTKALQYSLTSNKPILNHPESQDMIHHSYVNEGSTSVVLGIKGDPAIAEKLMLNRDIQLAEYSGAQLISHLISTSDSLKLIQEAKKKQGRVKATVSVMNLVETDAQLLDFDPAYKQSPPLRSESDRQSLIQGCIDQSIDAIVSNHTPLDSESKNLEFSYSPPGTIGLESCFALLNTRLRNQLNTETIIDYLSHRNRTCIGLDKIKIKIGEEANLTLFNPDEEWTFTDSDIGSRSSNTAYLNSSFVGRVYATIIKNTIFIK